MLSSLSQRGQALIEYVLLMVIMVLLGVRLISGFTDFMRTSVGNLGHVMSINLSVGVCPRTCFFESYSNGPPFPSDLQ